MIGRRCLVVLATLFVVMVQAASVRADARSQATASLKRALEFLATKQGKDGGWHSETYGPMRQGAAITAFVLYAASHAPEEMLADRRGKYRLAIEFLKPGIQAKGFVCNPDGTPDFPTYGSAMTLTAARRLKLALPPKVPRQLIKFLISAQIGESREFKPDSPHYGGWDLMGGQRVIGQTSGTNVSVGRFVLEALAESDLPEAKSCLRRAVRWTRGAQNFPKGDGGFSFTPEAKFQSNKAGLLDEDEVGPATRIRSYGTTTCDGICCLLYSGANPKDERVVAAVRWLGKRPSVKVVPGFDHFKQSTGWEKGLRYYYYSGLVKVLPLMAEGNAQSTKDRLIAHLVSKQRKDGSWVNDNARMREDDPLICTSLAVIALGEMLRQ